MTEQVALPKYIDYIMVRQYVAPISRNRLNAWARKGWVRTVKFGDSRQARRLFLARDISELLERSSAGKQPRLRSKQKSR